MTKTLRAACICLVAACASGTLAWASDEAAFKALDADWKKLSKNHDDVGNRGRRRLLLQLFDYRDLKACRKLLRSAYTDENLADSRIAAVQVLAACGDPKEVEWLLAGFKKEKEQGPQIALGLGLSFTAPADAPAVGAFAAAQVGKQKDEPQRALLEGLAELGEPAAFAPLAALAKTMEKAERATRFEYVTALGSCGREQAKEVLDQASLLPDADIRLAAALGFARMGGPDQPPPAAALTALTALVADADPRVVEAAAAALAKTKHTAAVKPMAEALRTAPLRTREALRDALKAITGRDAGHDADAWEKDGGTAPPPKLPVLEKAPLATDRVAVILDLSRSMDWNGRLPMAQSVLGTFVRTLPDGASLGVIAAGRTPVTMSENLATDAASRVAADEWIRKQTTARGCDMREAILLVMRQWPSVDTIVIATDSAPWGDTADDTPLEVMQEIRRENRTRRVHIHVVFTAPGGRFDTSETDESEYTDRKELLQQLAETSGGKLTKIE